jgi:hypothetical protein
MKFDLEQFKKNVNLKIGKVEYLEEMGVIFINILDSNIKHLRVADKFSENSNCINICHGESSKNGYWWDGELDYIKLNEFLLQYN